MLVKFIKQFITLGRKGHTNETETLDDLCDLVNKTKNCSLGLFFASVGGMSDLSCIEKLRCAMIVSDALYRMLYRLKPNKLKSTDDNSLQSMVSDFNYDKHSLKMSRLQLVSSPFAFIIENQEVDVLMIIGIMYKKLQEELVGIGGKADNWETFRKKIVMARKIFGWYRSMLPRTQYSEGLHCISDWETIEKELRLKVKTRTTDTALHRMIKTVVERIHPELGYKKRKKSNVSPNPLKIHTDPIYTEPVTDNPVVETPASNKRKLDPTHKPDEPVSPPMPKKKKVNKFEPGETVEDEKYNGPEVQLFHGVTTAIESNNSEAVIVIETFRRDHGLVKGITFPEEKMCDPGNLSYLNGENNNKKMTNVLLCHTTSSYLYAFKRAEMKPHFVLTPKEAKDYMTKVVNGKKTCVCGIMLFSLGTSDSLL